MSPGAAGIVWALGFVLLESIQFVFFGNVFQRISSHLFGFYVLAITTIAFVSWSALRRPAELRLALAQPRLLLAINVIATLSWVMFLLAVQIIEPAIAYTLGAAAMPLAAWAFARAGVAEGTGPRNLTESTGFILIFCGAIFLAIVTIAGWSGFVRGGPIAAMLGAALALGEGVLFTWLLVLCQRLDRKGVSANVVFGLRFPLYVVAAGMLGAMGFDQKAPISAGETAVIVALGLILIIPPLYALQRAVALISTLTISVLTALGPFVIFSLQLFEGRVEHSTATLIGLGIFFAGSLAAAVGAVRATRPS